MSESSFLEELLQEAEEKEIAQTEAFMDLLLLEIKKMQEKIEHNFNQSEKEIEIIRSFYLRKNSILDEKIKFLEKKLELFIRERGEKTITLPNGELKFHKKQDKVEIADLELFLKNAHKDLLDVVPEQSKPSLAKIKQWLKFKPVPEGITVIPGKQEFSYRITNQKEIENGREETVGIESERAEDIRIAV